MTPAVRYGRTRAHTHTITRRHTHAQAARRHHWCVKVLQKRQHIESAARGRVRRSVRVAVLGGVVVRVVVRVAVIVRVPDLVGLLAEHNLNDDVGAARHSCGHRRTHRRGSGRILSGGGMLATTERHAQLGRNFATHTPATRAAHRGHASSVRCGFDHCRPYGRIGGAVDQVAKRGAHDGPAHRPQQRRDEQAAYGVGELQAERVCREPNEREHRGEGVGAVMHGVCHEHGRAQRASHCGGNPVEHFLGHDAHCRDGECGRARDHHVRVREPDAVRVCTRKRAAGPSAAERPQRPLRQHRTESARERQRGVLCDAERAHQHQRTDGQRRDRLILAVAEGVGLVGFLAAHADRDEGHAV
mmetsp:Transcript_299/g.1204  ORF Transcript_299/g.1204 Transcript_299/m.1204 type:complete len:358 (-) Transcript_299:218-1291(-)